VRDRQSGRGGVGEGRDVRGGGVGARPAGEPFERKGGGHRIDRRMGHKEERDGGGEPAD